MRECGFRLTPFNNAAAGYRARPWQSGSISLPQGSTTARQKPRHHRQLDRRRDWHRGAFFGRINDARQFYINCLKLVCTRNPLPRGSTLEGDMNAISDVSTQPVPVAQTNYAVNAVAMICGLGIVVWVCMATSGLDMSVGFF